MSKACQSRKRGRPSGKDRTPLTVEERRERNALYERERRGEMAAAMAELADAAGCGTEISNTKLLQAVIALIRKARNKNRADDVYRENMDIVEQIKILELQVGGPL